MILSSFSKRSIWKTLVWIYRFPWSVLFLKFSGCIIWKCDWFVFFVPRFLGLMKLINTVFALRYVWSDFSDKHLWTARFAFSSGIILIFSKGLSWITFGSSSPLSRLLVRVSFFVLISGESDCFNDFCDLFMYERNSSTQFFLSHFTWWAETDKHLWCGNLLFSFIIFSSFSKRLIWKFGMVESATGMSFCTVFLDWWISSILILHFSISVRFFWLASLKC